MHRFSPATPTHIGCTQLLLAHYRLHCMLKSGRGNERQLHCLRLLRSSRQVDCARISRQLSDLNALIKSLLKTSSMRNVQPLSVSLKRFSFDHNYKRIVGLHYFLSLMIILYSQFNSVHHNVYLLSPDIYFSPSTWLILNDRAIGQIFS